MELVKGVPITDYCDQNRLPPRERLALFADVCQAVQHAHQKGIIHRDVKPSNVLIALRDGKPVVKVIDFGIAKALGERLTDKTLSTGLAQVMGTPLYMSPEQAGLRSGLGHRYAQRRLRAGRAPLRVAHRHNAVRPEAALGAARATTKMRRIIREEEPPKLRCPRRHAGPGGDDGVGTATE